MRIDSIIITTLGAALMYLIVVSWDVQYLHSPSTMAQVSKKHQFYKVSTTGTECRDNYRQEAFTSKSYPKGPCDCPLTFHMIWTTDSSSFNSHTHHRAIESVFFHHPKATVVIHSSILEPSHFQALRDKGYHLNIKPLEPEVTFQGTPLEEWYNQVKDDTTPSRHLYSHLTDGLRYALLWKEGGYYLDFDVLVVRNLCGIRNALGDQTSDLANGVNGAVMAFDKGHPLLGILMDNFVKEYKPQTWGSVGPRLITKIVNRFLLVNHVDPEVPPEPMPGNWDGIEVYDRMAFYPMDWKEIQRPKYWTPGGVDFDDALSPHTMTIHLWNKLLADKLKDGIPRGCFIDQLLNTFRVLDDHDDETVPPSGDKASTTELVVLGMHHSGTSLLAAVLQHMGAYGGEPGDLLNEGRKKFFEHRGVVELDQHVMDKTVAKMGNYDESECYSWAGCRFKIKNVGREASLEFQSRAKDILTDLRSKSPAPVMFIKDPRMCLTFPLWQPYFHNPICIHVMRDPAHFVARMSSKWTKLSAQEWEDVWRKYVVNALWACEDLPQVWLLHEDMARDPVHTIDLLYHQLTQLGVEGLKRPPRAVIEEIFGFKDGHVNYHDIEPEDYGVRFSDLDTTTQDVALVFMGHAETMEFDYDDSKDEELTNFIAEKRRRTLRERARDRS